MSDLHGERRPAAVESEHCRFCGHPNPAAAKYCNDCGSPLSLRPCALCGAINGRGATRCHACNAALPCATDARIAEETGPSGTPASPAPDADSRGPPARGLAASGRLRLQRAWPVLAAAIGVAAVAGYYAYGPAGEREAGSLTAVAPDREAQPATVPTADDAPRDGQATVASPRTEPGDAPPAHALSAPDGTEAATPAAANATAAAATAATAAMAAAGTPSGVESSAAKQGSPSAAATKRTTGRSTKPPSAKARGKAASSAKKDRPQGTKRAPPSKPPRAPSAPREGAAKPAAGAGNGSAGPAAEAAAR